MGFKLKATREDVPLANVYADALTHIVLVQWGEDRPWEGMAAFNVEEVAEDYAERCRKANEGTGLKYRVERIEL